MLFYDPLFLTLFPLFYVGYAAAANPRVKKRMLLVASLLFYTWGEPLFVPVLIVSTAIDYALSLHLQRADAEAPTAPQRHALLALGIANNLAVLLFYKYVDFLIANLNVLLSFAGDAAIPQLHIALPIGVSFVVFEKITYLVDTYRGTSRPARRFSDYCLFVLFFPKLLAGPILKYHEMESQIATPAAFDWHDLWAGFTRFAQGAFKKLLIADTVGAFTDQVFGADPWGLGAGYAWLGLVCFTLQIYFDFSGYSDMAIGLARMMGFGLRENFNQPYTATSITDFWLRWHMSLTTWIRDYLYVPLGGNRVSTLKIYRNLWICFLLSGLWHGANWTFVLWGAYNGLFLMLDRMFLKAALARCPRLVATAATLLIVMLGWAIFRAPTLAYLGGFLTALAGANAGTANIHITPELVATVILGALLSLLPVTPFYPALLRTWKQASWPHVVANAGYLVICGLAIARALAAPFQPFIYFRF